MRWTLDLGLNPWPDAWWCRCDVVLHQPNDMEVGHHTVTCSHPGNKTWDRPQGSKVCVRKGSQEHRATSGCLVLKQKIATLSSPICKVLTLNIECYVMYHVRNLCNTCWRPIQTYPSIDSHHECQRSTVRGSLPGWPAENKPSKSKYINLCDILYTKIY